MAYERLGTICRFVRRSYKIAHYADDNNQSRKRKDILDNGLPASAFYFHKQYCTIFLRTYGKIFSTSLTSARVRIEFNLARSAAAPGMPEKYLKRCVCIFMPT